MFVKRVFHPHAIDLLVQIILCCGGGGLSRDCRVLGSFPGLYTHWTLVAKQQRPQTLPNVPWEENRSWLRNTD